MFPALQGRPWRLLWYLGLYFLVLGLRVPVLADLIFIHSDALVKTGVLPEGRTFVRPNVGDVVSSFILESLDSWLAHPCEEFSIQGHVEVCQFPAHSRTCRLRLQSSELVAMREAEVRQDGPAQVSLTLQSSLHRIGLRLQGQYD